jgi:DNA-binding NarL/FixJ family response regulator
MRSLNTKAQVIVADDHSLVRQALRRLIEDEPDMVWADEAQDGREAIEKTNQKHPDIVILDIVMPVLGGLEAAREIAQSSPGTRILGLSMREDAAYAREMLRSGAHGYLTKSVSHEDLIAAIRSVLSGETVVSPMLTPGLPAKARGRGASIVDHLTLREQEVLRRFAEGATNKDVAAELSLSTHTVHAHRANIMKKLDLHSIGELVRFAMRHKLIE